MSTEIDRQQGRMLFQSAQNIRKSADSLWNILNSLAEKVESSGLGTVDWQDNCFSWAETEWLYTAFGYNTRISEETAKRRKGQRGRVPNPKPRGDITLLVRLCGSHEPSILDPNWPWLTEACLIVGWTAPDDGGEIENFEPIEDNTDYIQHCRNGLWIWTQEGCEPSYFFVLPLFSLKSDANLDSYVVAPLKSLFKTDTPCKIAEQVLRDIPVLLPAPE
jgi:hypothetical protein